jgi:N utilization substance protein B
MTKGRSPGARRRAREYALLALYRTDLDAVPVERALAQLWEALVEGDGLPDVQAPEEDEVGFAARIVEGVHASRAELDPVIDQASTNWRIPRMPLVDRNILRIAAWELTRGDGIPASVTCNEAVELAKRYGTAESRAFVNGIVDRMGRQLGRLPERR